MSLVESETCENTETRNIDLKTTNPIFDKSENSSVFKPSVQPKSAFSSTQNLNLQSKPKPPVLPKPRNRQMVQFCNDVKNETVCENSRLHVKNDSNLKINKSQISPKIQKNDDFNNNFKKHHFEDSTYLKVNATVPPPLPSRPPPVFKYPLGTFFKETESLTETNGDRRYQKQNEPVPFNGTTRDSSTNRKDKMIGGRRFSQETFPLNSKMEPKCSSSGSQNNKSFKVLSESDVELKVNKESSENFSQQINVVAVKENASSSSVAKEKPRKPLPTPTAELEFNEHSRKSFPLKSNQSVFQKRSISIPLGVQENRPPKPLPRPELHCNQRKSLPSDNMKEVLSNSSISTPLEVKNLKKQVPESDLKIKINKGSAQKSNLQAKNTEMKPNTPHDTFHQRLEQILVEQKRLNYPLEKNFTEFSETVWNDTSHPRIQENILKAKKTSFGSVMGSEIDCENLTLKPENFTVEDLKKDSSPAAELKGDLSEKIDIDQDQIADFSAFHSLNRPTLPQKIKSTQRSLSYTSLVQTVKDIGSTIWNPSDKSKRNSTGTISKITENITETQRSSSGHTKDTKPLESPEEEKAAIMRSAWFHDISATAAQHRLLNMDEDGAFLIRPTSRPTDTVQYTASITYGGRVFNIHIRRKTNHSYALGKEKVGEQSFQTISELVKYYQDMPFDIHPVGSSGPYAICFRFTPSRDC